MVDAVLMSGPIRPSVEAVLSVIASVRKQFPSARLYLSTWTDAPAIRAAVDVYSWTPEPSTEDIQRAVRVRTVQHEQLNLPDDTPGGKLALYKMIYGVQCVCLLASDLTDTDRVVRIRTDSIVDIAPDYLPELLALPPTTYITKRGDGLDWFALTTFATLKRTWMFPSLDAYTRAVETAWNPESLISRRIPTPIVYLDPTRVDTYILRDGGRKHYYP